MKPRSFIGYTGQTGVCRAIHSKEPIRVRVTPIIARHPRGVELYKKIATYMSDLATTFLIFTRDMEASDWVLGKDLDRLQIRNEASNGRLDQDKEMER